MVNEGDTLSLGKHTLAFVMAPMVHWPEVMVTYEATEKILFSADGFGKFGALDVEEDWACEARRYFINIVGKYGANVMALLKKAATLDIATICPLHGPILKENLGHYIGKYLTWASYEPEDEGVTIAYGSITATPPRRQSCWARCWRNGDRRSPSSIWPAATWPRPWRTPSATASWWWPPSPMTPACSRPWRTSCTTCS